MNVWLYWENKNNSKKPEYLDLCLRTIRKKCAPYTINILNEKTVYDFLPNLRKEIHSFPCLAHKADYIRAQLVYNHGGFWFDSDMILLKPLEYVEKQLKESGSDFIGCGRDGNRPSIGFFGGEKGCKLMEYWISDMDKVISESKNYKFQWTELGYQLLWKHSAPYNYYHYPFNICIPYFSGWNSIFFATDENEKQKYRKKLVPDTIMIALYNSMFPTWFKTMTEHDILSSNYYIADLLRENI